MKHRPMLWKIIVMLTLSAVLAAGCATPTALPTPTAAPTIDVKPTFDAIATQSAQTVVAELTLNAPPTATPVPPTNTPEPTATPGITDTPVPTATETRVFIPWTKTPTATQAVYGCSVTGVSPASGSTLKVNQDFDGKWTVKNTGTNTWNAGNTDIRFVEGTRFQQGGDVYDLDNSVAPNGTYTVTIDMKAPSTDGTYTTSWAINLEDGSTCSLTMTLNIKNE